MHHRALSRDNKKTVCSRVGSSKGGPFGGERTSHVTKPVHADKGDREEDTEFGRRSKLKSDRSFDKERRDSGTNHQLKEANVKLGGLVPQSRSMVEAPFPVKHNERRIYEWSECVRTTKERH